MPAQADVPPPLILLAHRAHDTVALLRSLLEREGFTALCAYNGRAAQQYARQHQPALLLLEQHLPLFDGLELCRQLRRQGVNAPVFILGDRAEELDKLLACAAGADDFLQLPLHPRELLGRVKATLRRTGDQALRPRGSVRCGRIELNPERREARAAGTILALTSLEYELLTVFVEAPGRVFPREALLSRLAGFLRGEPFDRTIDIHMSNLRRKLRPALGGADVLETVRGVGYRLRDSTTAGGMGAEISHEAEGLGRLALAALSRAPVPLLVLSPDRTVLLYNKAAEQLCGWTAQEVLGQVKCYSLLGCHDEAGSLLCHERCPLLAARLNHMSEQEARYVITLKDGSELPVTARYSRLNDGAGGAGEEGIASESTLLVLEPVR